MSLFSMIGELTRAYEHVRNVTTEAEEMSLPEELITRLYETLQDIDSAVGMLEDVILG